MLQPIFTSIHLSNKYLLTACDVPGGAVLGAGYKAENKKTKNPYACGAHIIADDRSQEPQTLTPGEAGKPFCPILGPLASSPQTEQPGSPSSHKDSSPTNRFPNAVPTPSHKRHRHCVCCV